MNYPIIVVEIPHQFPPKAYKIYSLRNMREIAVRDRSGRVAYEKTTPRELIANGCAETAKALCDRCFEAGDHAQDCRVEWCGDLKEGWEMDTPLYRADYVREEGEYSTEKINEEEALLAYIGDDLHRLYKFESEDDARDAVASELLMNRHQGIAAHFALKNLLGINDEETD